MLSQRNPISEAIYNVMSKNVMCEEAVQEFEMRTHEMCVRIFIILQYMKNIFIL